MKNREFFKIEDCVWFLFILYFYVFLLNFGCVFVAVNAKKVGDLKTLFEES
jgi:hypothetical protein